MLITDNAKIERINDTNIGLFTKSKKGNWTGPHRYYGNFEKAVKGILEYLTLDKITYVGDVQRVLAEFFSVRDRLDEIAKKILDSCDFDALRACRDRVADLEEEIKESRIQVPQFGRDEGWSV